MSVTEAPQALICSSCRFPIYLNDSGTSNGDDKGRHVYLMKCEHIICGNCHDKAVETKWAACQLCSKSARFDSIFRIYFGDVLGPATIDFREAQDKVSKLERANDELRGAIPVISKHANELAEMVRQDKDNLRKTVETVEELVNGYYKRSVSDAS